jgi:hypothetical protein
MRRMLILLALTGCPVSPVLGHGFSLHAQTQTSTPCPPTNTLDQLIVALDSAISGPANKDRSCWKQLFLPDARLIPIGPNGPHILTVDDWVTAVAKNGDAVVTEKQLKYQTQAFGHIAHLWSTYSTTLAGKPLARGINSIQAVYDGQSWHIIQVLWQAENATDQIPAQYLP